MAPIPVVVAAQPPAKLTAGGGHSCLLSAAGAAYCWGDGSSGQLGNGSTSPQLIPAPVAGGLTFVSVAAEDFGTCGLTAVGAAYCWGDNVSGQLGDGTTNANRLAPSPVATGVAFTSLTAGYYHACGLTSAGAAYCWGYDASGQLGDGTTTDARDSPVAATGGVKFATLTGGYWHTCGLTAAGVAYCWGNNNWAQLGDSTRIARTTAVPVTGGVVFRNLAAGGRHTCGLGTAGAAYCWGWNGFGQLGDGTTVIRLAPVPVAVPSNVSFVRIVTGWYHTCGLTAGGAAYCWGFNAHGQLGDGTTADRATPVAVAGGLAFASLVLGVDHTCATTTTGDAYCWGSNVSGQLGDGTTTDRAVPVAVRRTFSP
jgi:alpha-tubulin suppressor-like RCC1 family protein